ncbi:hypothetical protein [Rosettibacter firmus]|uniref:hypothetical protein n=1 Tax=Rosettibacter firmus TaxID=3111522 RepID=UPI00336BBF7C
MKKNIFITLLLIMSLVFKISFAQSSEEKLIKETIINLLNFSKDKSFEKAAKLIAYTGEDKTREYKTSFNPVVAEELNQVKRICKKISALMQVSTNYEFGKVDITKENNMNIYNAELIFKSNEEKLITKFRFVKTESGYLLLSVN